MGMDIVDTILANRRANRIIEAVDRSEYWQNSYNDLLDKYNALARKYDHDVSTTMAERDVAIAAIHDNIDVLPFTRVEINQRISDASDKAAQEYPL